ncbi:MAG: Autotransporter-associated beta strand repeat-containing protein, partial [Verrucomicrobia bacterium]
MAIARAMKNPLKLSLLPMRAKQIVVAGLLPMLILTGSPVSAADLYWDSDGTGASSSSILTGSGLGGGGTWDTTNARWWNGTGYSSWTNLNLDTALFWGTAGTVTLGTGITVGGLTFNTTGYIIDAGSSTLTFGATNNAITLNNVAAATLTGAVAGTGNVTLTGGVYGGGTAGTLTLNGTSTGGWSGTTTINNGMTMALAGSNQALLNTSGITLNGGAITLTNTTSGEAALNRVSNTAGITSNGGTITFTNTSGTTVYSEGIGSVALTSGLLNVVETTNQAGTGSQTLTLAGLTRTGASNTSGVAFSAGSGLNTTKNMIVVTGATATTSGQIIGPWATTGTAANAQTDYAVYNSSSQVVPANISASAETTWTTAANAYTLSGASTLTASRTINALRYSGSAQTLSLGTATFNLETFGVLNGGSGLLTISNGGTGALRTPSGGGNLFLTTGNNQGITVSAPITDNSGNTTLVVSGTNTVTLGSTGNTYSGGTVINGGTLAISADSNLGNTAGGIIFNGSGQLSVTVASQTLGATRSVTINNGALAQINVNNIAGTVIAGPVTGSGGISVISAGTQPLSLTSTGNTFQGPLIVSGSATRSNNVTLGSLADSSSANGAIVLGNTTGVGTLTWGATSTGPLTLNNRQIALLGTTGGGTIDNSNTSGANLVTINTDLLASGGTAAKTLTLQGANSGVFAGRISNDASGQNIAVTKGGTGNWTLGSTANTFNGTISSAGTTTSAGTLTFASAGGGNAVTVTQTTSTFGLRYIGSANQSLSGALSLAAMTTGTFTLDASGSGTFSLTNTGTTGVAASGNKNLVLTGSNTGNNVFAPLYVNNTGGAATLTKTGAGTWVLTNNNTYTGATTVNAGTLRLDATGVATPASGVVASGSALTLGGGTVDILGNAAATTQTFASTALTANTYSVLSSSAGVGGLTVNTGTVTRGGNAGLNIVLGTGSPSVVLSGLTATNNVIASGTTNAAFVTLNGTDWANLSGSNPVAATYGTNIFSAGTNTDVTTTASPSAFTTNTLRFNTGSPTLTLTGTNLLNAGGILIGSGAGAVTVDGTGTIAGTGATGTNVRELNVFQNSSSVASLNAVIADNRAVNAGQAPATSLNKFGTGTLILGASNTFTGGVTIGGGTLQLGNAGALNSLRPNAVTVGSAGVLSLNNNSTTVSGLSAPVAGAVVQNGGTTSNAVLTARIGAANAFAGVLQNGSSSTLGLTVVPTAATGILTLTGVNSYTGPTVLGGPGGVAGGGLTLNSTGQLTGTSGITLNGGTLTMTNTNVVEGAIDRVNNAAGITSNGGAITYTNTAGAGNSYAETLGALTLSSGRLTVTSTNATTSPATQALTFSNGTGLASRAASNTSTVAFLGGTALGTTAQNQIFITGQAATSAGVPIGAWATAGVGTTAVDYAAYGSTFGVTPLNATSTLADDTTWNTSYSNNATGNINFGSGTTTTTLTASRVLNTLRYTGGAATLALAGNSLTTQGVLQGGSGLLTISSTGGTITSGGNPDYNLYVTLGAAQGITVSSGNITNNGSNPVTLVLSAGAAASTLTLTPTTNTYTGGTVINSGTLSIAGDGGLGSSGGLTFNGSGGLTFATNAVTVGSGRTVTLNNGSRATITLSNVAGNTIAGQITGTGGLTVTAGGTTGTTLALTATNNDFTGPIQIGTSTQATGLTVSSLADAASPGTGDISFGSTTGSGTLTWASTATGPLTLNNRSIALAGTTGGGVIDNSNATAANAITINPDLIVTGSGNKTLTLQGANTGANAFAGAINDGAGSVISVAKGGAGNWTLSNTNNTATGNLTVAVGTSGTLTFASWGSGTGGVTTSGTAAALTGTLRYTGSAPLNMSGAVSLSSQTTGTLTLDSSGSGAWNLSNTSAIVVGAGSKTLALAGTNAGDNTLAGLVQNNTGTNTTALTKSGAGRWILTNANTYSGATTISLGTLQLGNALAVQNSGVAVGVNNGLAFSSGITNFTLGNLSGAGNLAMTDTAAAAVNLTVGGNNAATSTFSGNLSGAGNFTKVGTGTLTLSGTGSSNSGTVTVDGGTLSANPSAISSATGTITVGSTITGSVLDLYADNAAAITNLVGGVNLVLGGGTGQSGALGFNLGASGTGDQLVFSGGGSLTIASGGIGLINASALSGFNAGTWTLASGGTANSTSFALGNLPAGFGYSLTQDASSLSLTATTAPATMWWKGDIGGSWNTVNSGGAATNWDTDSSTGIDAAATPGTGTTVNFSATGAGNFTSTLDAAFSIAGLNVTNNVASAVTINPGTGGTLTIGSGGINVQAGAQTPLTIGAPVTLGGVQTWIVADSGSTLAFSGSLNNQANALTLGGAGTKTLSGLISGTVATGTTGLTVSGGTVNLSNTGNTFTGDLAIDGSGVLVYTQGTATTVGQLGQGSSTNFKQIVLTNGGTFRVTTADFNVNVNTSTNRAAGAVFNIGTGGGTFDVTSGRTFTLDDGTVSGTGFTAAHLQGSGTLTKAGTGTLVLRNQNVFAGAIDITDGLLQISGPSAFGLNSAGTTIRSGTALNLNGQTVTDTEPLTIYGAGLTASPVGALTNSTGTGTWIGPVTLGGNATIGGGAGALTLSAGATVNSDAFTLTISHGAGRVTTLGVISGSGPVDVTGTNTGGDWVSTGLHLYSGGTTLNSGSQTVVGISSVGVGAGVTSGPFGTGTLILNGGAMRSGTGASFTVGNTLTLQGDSSFYTTVSEKSLVFAGPVTLTGGTRTLTSTVGTTVAGTTIEFSGAIGDGGNNLGLTKAGAGNLTLSGTNTYSGTTTISGGTLIVGNGGATGDLSTGPVVNNAALVFNRAGSMTVPGAISGNGSITKQGSGTVVLGNVANTNSGTITVNGGTLSVHPSAIAAASGITVGSTVTGSVLDLYADNAAATTNLAGGTNLTLGGTGGLTGALGFNLGASGTGDRLVFSGGGSLLIGSGGVGLINASAISGFGAGTWTLVSGGTANSTTFGLGALPGGFTYSLTQSATSLSLTAAAAAAGNVFWAGDLGGSWSTLTGGGTSSNWSTSAGAITPDFAATPGSANTVNFSSTGAANFSTTLDNAFSIAGLNFTNVGSAVTIAPGTGGTLQIGSGGIAVNTGAPTGSTISAPVILGANNTWTVTDAATTLTVSGAVSETGGARTLAKAGSGTLVLSGANSYTGTTTVSAGALNIQNATALGTTAAGTTVSSGAALQIQGGITVGAESLSLNGTGVSTTGALRNISGNNTYGGLVTLAATTRINSDAGTLTLSNAGTITGATFGLTVGGAGDTVINSIIGTTTGTVTRDGLGKLTLTGANTYTGATTLTTGVINAQNNTAFGTTAGGVSLSNVGAAVELQGGITIGAETLSIRGFGPANSGALRNISGTNTWGGAITQAAASRINSDAGTLILDVSTGSAITGTFGLTLGGAGNGEVRDPIATSTGSVTKDGAGQWSFRPGAVNSYTGGTIINNGTLLVDFVNATPATNLISASSALTLGGGTLSVVGKGSTINSQTFASVALTAGTSSSISLNRNGATSLTLALGALTRGANSALNLDLIGSPTLTWSGTTTTNGILTGGSGGPAYATIGKADWATSSGAYSGYSDDTYGTTVNTNLTTSASPAAFTTNTLRLNTGTPTLTLTGTNLLNAGGVLIGSGAGAVTVGGTGTLSGIAQAAAANGEFNVFQYSASAATLSASVVNNPNGVSWVTATPYGGTFNKFGDGALILSSTRNAWTGGTNIGGGTLRLGASNVIPDGLATPGALNIGSAASGAWSGAGVLDLNGFNDTINGLTGSGVVDNTAAGASTLTVGNTNATSTFAGTIRSSAGTLNLVKTGTGALTLTGANTYTGTTTVNQGTLTLNFSGAATGAPFSNILPATTALTLGSGTLNVTGLTAATPINNTQALGSTTLTGGATVTMAGSTSGLTSLSLGAISRTAGLGGTVNITGLSSFLTVGTTTANNAAGILGGWATVAGVDWATVNASGNIVAYSAYTGTLPTATTTNVNGNYTISGNQSQTGAVTINSLKATGTATITTANNNLIFSGTNGGLVSSGTLTIGAAATDTGTVGAGSGNEFIINNSGTVTLNVLLNTGSGGLTKSGAGTLNLRNSTASASVTGPIVINGGTIDVDANGRLGTGTSLVLNGGGLTFNANADQTRNLTLGAAGGTLTLTGAIDATRSATSTTAVAFTGTGPRTLTIATGVGGRIWSLPAVLGDAPGGQSPTSLAVNLTSDTAFFRLSAANTYSGNTTISRGILRMEVANAIGSGAGGLTSAATTGNIIFTATGTNRAILETNATVGTITRSLGYGPGQIHWEGNGGFSNASAATQVVNLGGAAEQLTWGAGGFVPTGSRLQLGQASNNSLFGLGTIDFQNAIALGTTVRTIEAARAQGTTTDRSSAMLEGILSGAITSGAGGGIAKEGTGTIMLTGNNSGGSATVAVNAGALYFASTGAIPGTGANITLSTTVNGNAAIGVAGDTNPTTTFAGRIANAGSSTAAFLLGANSSAALDFTSYPNMRLAALAFQNASTTPIPLATAVTFTGSVTPAGGTYRFGGLAPIQNTNAAAGTLVLGRKDILTGANGLNLSFGALTITAANNFTGGTVIDGNAITVSSLGIGDNAALGTGAVSLQGTRIWAFGAVNGDHSVSNNINIDVNSTASTWIAGGGGGTSEYSILNNTNQKTLSYLGTVDLKGRSTALTIAGNVGGTLFLGDIANAGATLTLTAGANGYLSLLTTTANGGVPKTYSQNTTLTDNTNLVIDSASSLGTSGTINQSNSIILLQPGTGSISLNRNFVNTAAKNPSFNTPAGSTLVLTGTMSGSTTGIFVKQGLGDLVLRGDATAVLTTGSLQVRSGKMVLDAATLGSAVFPNVAIALGRASEFSNGGILEITGTSAQSLGAVTVNQRASQISLTGAMALTLGAITRTTGSTLDFSVPTGTVNYTTAATAGLVNGSTTWNGNDWAAANGSNLFALGTNSTSYNALTGTGAAPTISSNATANYLIGNTTSNDVTLAATGTLGAPNDVNTIKYNDSAARTIDLGSGFLRLGTGGAAAGGVT